MISPAIVDQIAGLLAEGKLSQRKIARLTRVSRGTVGQIARGHRPRVRASDESTRDPTQPLVPPRRCGGCGGLVYPPCILCRVRTEAAKRGRGRASETWGPERRDGDQ